MRTSQMQRLNRILRITAVVCAVSVFFMVVALAIPRKAMRAEFIPPDFAIDARRGVPTVSAQLSWVTLDEDGVEMKVSVCTKTILTEDRADVYFTNHEANEEWMKLRIMDEEQQILAETGLIKPGEYIQTIEFDVVPKSGQTLTYKIMAYEPETYYSAGAFELQALVQRKDYDSIAFVS